MVDAAADWLAEPEVVVAMESMEAMEAMEDAWAEDAWAEESEGPVVVLVKEAAVVLVDPAAVTVKRSDCARIPVFIGLSDIKLNWKFEPGVTSLMGFTVNEPAEVMTLVATVTLTGGLTAMFTSTMENIGWSVLTEFHLIVFG